MWNHTKNSTKKLKRPNSLFLQREVSSAVLKHGILGKLKRKMGGTMRKSTSSAFQKCGTFCVYDFLKGSYWLSKLSNISIFFDIQKRCQKKRHGHNFEFSEPALNQGLKKWVSQALIQWRVWKLKIVAVTIFCDIAYFSGQQHFCCPLLALSSNNSPLETPTPKKYDIFGKLRTWAFSWWYLGFGYQYQKLE